MTTSYIFTLRSLRACIDRLPDISFFTPDHVLFASDCPFDPEKGRGYIRATIEIMESLDLSPQDKDKICHGNAQKMFGIA